MFKKYQNPVSGNLVLNSNEGNYDWWGLILVLILIFIPIVNLLDLILLLPFVLIRTSLRTSRYNIYKKYCLDNRNIQFVDVNEQELTFMGDKNNSDVTSVVDVKQPTLLKPSYGKIFLISIACFLLDLVIGGRFMDIVIYVVLGTYETSYAQGIASNLVYNEVSTGRVNKVTIIENGQQFTRDVTFDNTTKEEN